MIAVSFLERVKGIEPSYSAWEADVLPLNYTRDFCKGQYNTQFNSYQYNFIFFTAA